MTIVRDEEDSGKTFKIAVYGSLRKGLGNHGVIKDAKFLGDFESQPEYTMYSIGGSFPGLVNEGNTSVQMEVYEVGEATFEDVNNLEGFIVEDDPYNMYNRVLIDTPYGPAYSYIYNGNTTTLFVVESGDWTKYKQASNVVNAGTC